MTYDVEKVVLGGGVTNVGEPLLNAVRGELTRMHAQSDLARMLLPTDKVMLLPTDFNPGISGAIRMAREAVST
jgi:glucokinase